MFFLTIGPLFQNLSANPVSVPILPIAAGTDIFSERKRSIVYTVNDDVRPSKKQKLEPLLEHSPL
jgi:hypothetical protein